MLNTMTRKNIPDKINLLSDQLARIRQARDEEICKLYAAYLAEPVTGWTLEKIGEKYGLSRQRVWKIWKRYNPD
jgi:DNA-directed RNA polymerase sigma subunit (sigma70/sigma32)